MSATKVLALATLFLATTLAQAEWKEFTFRDGNFKVVFPNNPQRTRGTHRNLHQFSAIASLRDNHRKRKVLIRSFSRWCGRTNKVPNGVAS
jgi:hypothetical protein